MLREDFDGYLSRGFDVYSGPGSWAIRFIIVMLSNREDTTPSLQHGSMLSSFLSLPSIGELITTHGTILLSFLFLATQITNEMVQACAVSG